MLKVQAISIINPNPIVINPIGPIAGYYPIDPISPITPIVTPIGY